MLATTTRRSCISASAPPTVVNEYKTPYERTESLGIGTLSVVLRLLCAVSGAWVRSWRLCVSRDTPKSSEFKRCRAVSTSAVAAATLQRDDAVLHADAQCVFVFFWLRMEPTGGELAPNACPISPPQLHSPTTPSLATHVKPAGRGARCPVCQAAGHVWVRSFAGRRHNRSGR